jgi:hypothetical protein
MDGEIARDRADIDHSPGLAYRVVFTGPRALPDKP